MNDAKSQPEPSMEEILASIRRIISEDGEGESKGDASAAAPEPPPAKPAEPAPAAAPAPAPAQDTAVLDMDEDVLELTQMVQDDDSGFDLPEEPEPEEPVKDEWTAPPRPAAPEPPRAAPIPTSFEDEVDAAFNPDPPEPDEELLSPSTAEVASAAFAQLANFNLGSNLLVSPGGRTLEDIVKELLKPLMREWLDRNLPPVVERLVQKEIERLVRRSARG